MSSLISHLAAAINNPGSIRVTSQNPKDLIRAALDGKADLSEAIRTIMAAGTGVQDISQIFADIGMQKSTAASAFIKGVGINGTGQDVKDYAKTLDRREAKDFFDRSGYRDGGAGSERAIYLAALRKEAAEKAEKEADLKWAGAFGALSHAQQGAVISHMLFSPGHDQFWDQMAANGVMSAKTAENGKQMAAKLPAEAKSQQESMEAAVDGAKLAPEERAKAEEFKKSKEAKELAEKAAKIKLLKEHEEEAKRNGDIEYAKRVEEERRRVQEQYAAQVVAATQDSPGLRQALLDQAPISPEQRQAAYRSEASSENATVAALAGKLAVGDVKAADRLVRENDEMRLTVAKAMIAGTEESKSQAASDVGKRAIANGAVSVKDLSSAAEKVTNTETAKVATLAVKGSDKVDDDEESMFAATPPIASKLAQMRAPKEEAAPALAKTASMSA